MKPIIVTYVARMQTLQEVEVNVLFYLFSSDHIDSSPDCVHSAVHHKIMMLCGPIVGAFQLQIYSWLLGWTGNCFIQVALACHEDHHFKFHEQNWAVKLQDIKVNVMFILKWSHRLLPIAINQLNLVYYLLFEHIVQSHHGIKLQAFTRLKYRHLIEKSDR